MARVDPEYIRIINKWKEDAKRETEEAKKIEISRRPSFGKLREIEAKMPAPPAVKPVSVSKPADKGLIAYKGWPSRLPKAFGIGVLKGGEDVATLFGGLLPSSEEVKRRGQMYRRSAPPSESSFGELRRLESEEAAREAAAKTKVSAPALGHVIRSLSEKKVIQPLTKKAGLKGTFGEKFVGGLGEFVIPSLITRGYAGGLARLGLGGVGATGAAAKSLGKAGVLKTAGKAVVKGTPEAVAQWGLMEAPKPEKERTPLALWLAQYAIFETGGQLAGKAARRYLMPYLRELASWIRDVVAGKDVSKVELPKVESKGYVPPKRVDIEPETAEVKVTEAPAKGAGKEEKAPTRPKTTSAETASAKRQKLAQNIRSIAQGKIETPSQPSAKEPWQMTRQEYAWTRYETPEKATQDFAFHKTAVETALKEGKPVPPEVLKDYPDLAETASVKKLAQDIRNIAQGKRQTTSGKKAEFFGDTGTVGAAKLNIPEKGSVIEGTTQKVRSFPVSVAKSPKTKDELKFGVLAEIYEGGRGAYEPVKLKDVYEQAGEIVDKTPDAAVNMIYGEGKPSALQTAVGIRLIEKYQNEGDFDKAIDAALTLSEKLTRNGQAIAAARLINWATPEGAILTAQRQVKNAVKGLTKTGRMSEEEARLLLENPASEEAQTVAQKYGLPTLTPDIAEKIKGLTDALQNAGDEAARWEAMAELKAFLQSLKPSSLLRKISAAQIIAQLLNPKTQVRNILGNELFYRLERINKFVATPIDWARTKLTGKPRTVTFSTGGQGGFWEGFLKGWSAGWKGVSPHGLETQFDIGKGLAFNPRGNPAERVMSFLERALWATMHGFDYAAYNRAYKQTLGELAVLRAMNEGQKVTKELIEQYMREADANLVNIADQYGKYVTFQDDNVFSKTFAGAKRLFNLHKEFGLGDLVIKYPRTPGALLARGLEYSPAGFLRSAYQIAMAVWRSLRGEAVKSDERELLLGLSRGITGTLGLTGLGYFLYDVGIITGPTETDSDVAAMQKQLGTHPYRVNVTALKRWVMSGFNPDAAKPQEGDLFVSYDWAQPVAMAIAMGANTAKEAEDARLKSLKEKITNFAVNAVNIGNASRLLTEGISAGVETLAEQPVLTGLLQLFTKYGNEPAGQALTRNLISAVEGAPASFVPTLLSQIRALANNTARITWSKSPIQQAINQVKYKIPGLASTLPPAYTTLGQPKETYPGGGNTLFNVFLNPAYVSRYRPTKEQLMPLEVWKETGETTQFPRAVDRYFMIGGKRIDLTPEEMSEYQRILGTLAQRGFSMIPPEMAAQDKKKVMDKIIEQANLAAKVLILVRRVAKKKGNSQ